MNMIKTFFCVTISCLLLQACLLNKETQSASTSALPNDVLTPKSSAIAERGEDFPIGVDPALQPFYFINENEAGEFVIEPNKEVSELVASIQKTACYGNCPVYEAKVFSNGLVLYEGKRFADLTGLYEAYVVQDELDSLYSKANEITFFKLSDAYPTGGFELPDLPSTITYLKTEDNEKSIRNNHNAPKTLRAYEIYFEQFLNNLEWQPILEQEN